MELARLAPQQARAGGRRSLGIAPATPFSGSAKPKGLAQPTRRTPEDSPDFRGGAILDELLGQWPIDDNFAEANRRAQQSNLPAVGGRRLALQEKQLWFNSCNRFTPGYL